MSRRVQRPVDITDPRSLRGPRRWRWVIGAFIAAITLLVIVAREPAQNRVEMLRITRKANWRTDVEPKIDVEEWLFYVAQRPDFRESRRRTFEMKEGVKVHVLIDGIVMWTGYSKGRTVFFNYNGSDIEVFEVDDEIRRKMCGVASALAAHVADASGSTVSCR